MAKTMSFTIAEREVEDTPIDFELDWKEKPKEEDGEKIGHTETFIIHPSRVGETTILKTGTIFSNKDLGPLFRVFEKAMDDDEYDRFFKFCEDKDHLVDGETLINIMSWVIEEATAFPTQQPSPSAPGR
jgi:hypothetical protein